MDTTRRRSWTQCGFCFFCNVRSVVQTIIVVALCYCCCWSFQFVYFWSIIVFVNVYGEFHSFHVKWSSFFSLHLWHLHSADITKSRTHSLWLSIFFSLAFLLLCWYSFHILKSSWCYYTSNVNSCATNSLYMSVTRYKWFERLRVPWKLIHCVRIAMKSLSKPATYTFQVHTRPVK